MLKKQARVALIEPMLLLRTEKLPEGPEWLIELKLDGYRTLVIQSGGKVQLRSRNANDFSRRYPGIVQALSSMPDETVIDAKLWLSIKKAGLRSTLCRIIPLAIHSTFSSSICWFSKEET